MLRDGVEERHDRARRRLAELLLLHDAVGLALRVGAPLLRGRLLLAPLLLLLLLFLVDLELLHQRRLALREHGIRRRDVLGQDLADRIAEAHGCCELCVWFPSDGVLWRAAMACKRRSDGVSQRLRATAQRRRVTEQRCECCSSAAGLNAAAPCCVRAKVMQLPDGCNQRRMRRDAYFPPLFV
ncbi:unnamed protein product [Pelagomonas calceolata]|uniref:Uncharacterized protein n=1 Tax=Pelagomonas calceolata TaxID=35677 RepID=A0A8J2SRB9_9STRA|nr:unnamed protein product [Pelagomonas calceolata]